MPAHSNRPRNSLPTRIVLMCGLAFIVIQAMAVTISAWMMKSQVEKSVFSEATAQSRILVDQIVTRMSQQNAIVRSTAGSIEASHKAGTGNRAEVLSLLNESETRFTDSFGMWMEETPSGFDGRRDAHAIGSNSNGIFFPYFTRKADKSIEYHAIKEQYDHPWYTLPMARGNGILTAPYVAESNHVEMVSFAYPVVFDGKKIGVTGIDTPLDWIVTLLGNAHIFGSRNIALISDDMLWIANPDETLLMQPYKGEGTSELSRAVSTRKIQIIRGFQGGTQERIMIPFVIPGFDNVWTLVVDVPVSALSTPVRNNVVALVTSGFVLMVLSVLLIYLISGRLIRKPFRNLLAAVSDLSHGRYDDRISGTDRRDEIGMVAQGLEGFRVSLLKARHAEVEAAETRRRHERLEQKARQEEEEKIRNVDRVIRTMDEGLSKLAKGDLSFELSDSLPLEFEPLRRNFNQSVRQLADALSEIAASGRVIRTGTSDVASGADDLAQRTEQQAAALEQTVAAVTETTQSVASSAAQIGAAQKIGLQARGSATASSEIMRQTHQAMQRIEESSRQIVTIVEAIDGIAFQTNILALNAAVEAARAGEAGRGFAVVASEVRALALRCAQAAKDIGTLVRKTGSEIQTGSKCVSDTGKALKDISDFIARISDSLNQILVAAQEQSSSLSEINIAVSSMDQTTQKNAAAADHSRAASRSLAGETERLTALINRFRVPGSTNIVEYRLRDSA
ncbi:methyl-accepting chemotaxis protein [Gluconacetobacter azotocaptans]|uniref:Methyl-accepting chemotaxis protein n=1 Tax=Gluconacetobacter azotocaptans TaxID=142834 RepID=A0A7W4JQW8_9PROT|nr:methyl-accepting chemotaxis protein [Gluconacetobacter azotocaptans]MBB2189280.1 methyl-accepting chemotaxis protein [Gluconacetobacter azotocaptans]